MSGCGAVTAQTDASTTSAAPAQRNGDRSNPMTMMPALIDQQGSGPERSHAADGAGKRGHPLRHGDHPADAEVHQPPEHAIKSEWHGDQSEQSGAA